MLSSKFITKLSNLAESSGYRAERLTYSLHRTNSLKDILLDPVCDIQLVSTNSFLAKIDRRLFSECLQRDIAFGSIRFRSMYDWSIMQGEEKIPGAWLTVSNYYSLFFLVNELLRIAGRFVVYFPSETIYEISSKAQVSSYLISKGTWCGIASHDESGEVKIRFSIRNGGHHEQVWKEVCDIFSKIGLKLNADGKDCLERILLFMGNDLSRWRTPNSIRNEWNYSKPELFGRFGELSAKELRKQCGNVKASFGWASSRKLHLTPANEILGINYSLGLLSIVYENLLGRLLNAETLKEIQRL